MTLYHLEKSILKFCFNFFALGRPKIFLPTEIYFFLVTSARQSKNILYTPNETFKIRAM